MVESKELKEYEITVRASVESVFYIEAYTEEEAMTRANIIATTNLEQKGLRVDDIEEIDVAGD